MCACACVEEYLELISFDQIHEFNGSTDETGLGKLNIHFQYEYIAKNATSIVKSNEIKLCMIIIIYLRIATSHMLPRYLGWKVMKKELKCEKIIILI